MSLDARQLSKYKAGNELIACLDKLDPVSRADVRDAVCRLVQEVQQEGGLLAASNRSLRSTA